MLTNSTWRSHTAQFKSQESTIRLIRIGPCNQIIKLDVFLLRKYTGWNKSILKFTNSLLNCDEFGISTVFPFLDRSSRAFRRFSLFTTFRGGVDAFVSMDCSSSKSSSIDDSRRFSIENFIPNDLSMHVAAWPITLENRIRFTIKSRSFWKKTQSTVFENHRKSLIQDCERSELRLYFERTKVH